MSDMVDNQNRRVLVIDDNHSIHDDFRKILAPARSAQSGGEDCEKALFGDSDNTVGPPQFEVSSAFQGQEGAVMVKKAVEEARPYAMAFVDVRMPPGWDGIETTQRIWEIDPDIQIVICTAHSDYSWSEMFAKIGHRDGLLILKKPFDTVEASQLAYALTEKWELHLRSRRKAEELESQVAERTRVLHESEARLRCFNEAVFDGIAVTEHGTFVDLNPRLVQLLGYERSELVGRRVVDIVAPEDRPLVQQNQETGFELPYENRLLRKNGSIITVETRARQCIYFGRQMRLSAMHDITERKEAENRLLRLSNEQRVILEATALGISFIRGRNVQWANPAFNAILGYAIGGSLGMDTESFYAHREDYERTGRAYGNQLVNDGIYATEVELKRKDGASFWCQLTGKAVNVSRVADGSIWILEDVTERKKADAENLRLEDQNRQLQKSESLARMAGAIAHHFNNQLQAVMMGLEMAMNDLPENSGLLAALTDVLESAGKAAEVSKLMLTCLGQTGGERHLLDLSEACLRSLPLLRLGLPRNLILKTDLLSPGPFIHADANQIQQVLTNLVTNSREAGCEKEGAISLSVSVVSAGAIAIVNRYPINGQLRDGAYACLEIADKGSGIAKGDIEKVFDPFYSTKFTGRGLGLAVVLGIVRAHDGAITVESEPGQGSVFRVFLPVSEEPTSGGSKQVNGDPKLPRGGTILLVDDEASVLKPVTLALNRLGFAVLTAVDGGEAVETFQGHRDEIRLVLCDLTMPRLDGWETLTALRKLAPGLPIILASGYSETQVLAGHHVELPQAILTKPYAFEKLRDTVARVLGKQESKG